MSYCKIDECPCHNFDFELRDLYDKKKLYKKFSTALILKPLTIQICGFMFRQLVAHTKRGQRSIPGILAGQFLISHTSEYMKAFTELSIIKNLTTNPRRILIIEQMQGYLERFLNMETHS